MSMFIHVQHELNRSPNKRRHIRRQGTPTGHAYSQLGWTYKLLKSEKNTLVAPFLCLRYSPKLTGANTNELGRSRTWVSQARNRRQRVLLMPRKLPLPHDLLLKVREGLLDLTPWNLVIPRHRPSCAQVVDFLPLCNHFETKSNTMHTKGLRPILPPNVCLKQKLKRATPCTHLIIDSY